MSKKRKHKIKAENIAIVITIIVVVLVLIVFINRNSQNKDINLQDGFKTKIILGDTIPKLVETGAIDLEKFKQIYEFRSELTEEQLDLLTKKSNEPLILTTENANFLINILWPLGIANKNPILDEAQQYEGIENLASTGGWILGKEDTINYFNKFELIKLTKEQQANLEEVANNAFRPCCNNPTSFPDCNHGAALLALLELGASQGLSKEELYTLALQANTLWFPQQYLSTFTLYKSQNKDYWKSAKEIMSEKYSSISGWINNVYKPLQQQGLLPQTEGGEGCGI